MFVAYDGPHQRFDSSNRQAVAKHKARRHARKQKFKARADGHSQWTGSSVESSSPRGDSTESECSSTDMFEWTPITNDTEPTEDSPETSEMMEDMATQELQESNNSHGMTTDLVPNPIAAIDIGGFRTDPFRCYPIKAQTYFDSIIDFCMDVVAPTQLYFNYIMQHDVLFEAIVTYALCAMPASRQSPAMKLAMMHHHGSTLAQVNQRLSSPHDSDSDAVILAICNLIVISALHSDTTRFETHLAGLRRLVALRGGIENLGLNGLTKAGVLGIEAIVSLPPRPCRNKPTPTIETPDVSTVTHLTYPDHPFPPDLCVVISKLPSGFRELALTRRLSIQLIHRLDISRDLVVLNMANRTGDSEADWGRVFKIATRFEQMVWLTLLVYYLRSTSYQANCKSLADAVLECSTTISTQSRAETEWLLWASMISVATPDPDDSLAREKASVLRMVFGSFPEARNWGKLEKVLKKFLWNDGLSLNLRHVWKTQFDTTKRKLPPPSQRYIRECQPV